MKTSTSLLFALLLGVSPVSLFTQGIDATSGLDLAEAAAEVDDIFQQWDSTDSPGCAVAASQDGRPLLSAAYGMADLEHSVPNTPSTIFEAGSVSKQFAAAAVVLLAMDGELSLDDDVRHHVPEVPDYGETITIRHLVTHTSGLRDWGSVAGISGWGRGNRTHDHDHVLEIVSRQSQLNFAPGERYSYSNTGYNLLAIIVDRVVDGSFAEFSKERIFKPLGMSSTQWRDDYTRIVNGRSSAYTARSDSTFAINRPIENVHANGGLLTTVGDLLLWNHVLDTGQHFGHEFVERMHEIGQLNNNRTINYGIGLQHLTANGHPTIRHTGATSGYRAYLARFPEQGLSVAMLCNVTNVSTGGMGNAVAALFLPDTAESESESQPESPQKLVLPASALEVKAGFYKDPLTGNATLLVVEEGELQTYNGTTLTPLSDMRFQVGSGDHEFMFSSPGNSDRQTIRIYVEGYEEGSLVPVEPFDPTERDLEAFAGTFHSDDAETTLEIGIKDGELVAHRRPARSFSFTPVYTDAFHVAGLGLVRFHRNEDGQVTGFGLSRSRVYDIRFGRVE